MGSIYEYSLQFKPGIGRCVPEFIMVHEVHQFCPYSNTHFGYAESGCSSRGTIEYSSKQAFLDRIHQIHSLSPYVKNIGRPEEPNFVDLTIEEVNGMVDVVWSKTETINAIIKGDTAAVDFYFNDYELQYFFGGAAREPDLSVVSCIKTPVPDFLDVYWPAAPVLTDGTWVQQWAGRPFTPTELAEYKKKKRSIINEERYATIDSGFVSESKNKLVNADLNSRVNIDQEMIKALLSTVNGEPSYNLVWRFADGSMMDLTREEMIVLGEERRSFIEEVYQKSWSRKFVVENASSRKEIDEV